mgnify:CR=1 FL=1
MIQISVAAPCNDSGKTSLLLSILSTFPRIFSAAKFTTIYQEEQVCPVGNTGCPCHRLQTDYLLCKDLQTLGESDTDTGKIIEAGAWPIFWGVARPDGYPALVEKLHSSHFHQHTRLVTEGNSILEHLVPDLLLFIVNPYLSKQSWKRNSEKLLAKSDFVVVNPFSETSAGTDHSFDLSVEQALTPHQTKRVDRETWTQLDQWKDQRIFYAIQAILTSSPIELRTRADQDKR